MPLSTGTKILIGVGVGLTGAYLLNEAMERGFRIGPRPEEDEEPEPAPQAGTAAGAAAGATKATQVVPAKGAIPYNMAMFPSQGAVMGALAGLTPSYSSAQFPETFPATVGAFQADWNTLAGLGLLLPKRLNSSRLAQDEDPGPQVKRALEWARGMDWGQRMHAAGLQP